MEIVSAALDDAEAILALQRLAYQTEAALYDDFTLPPLIETLAELRAHSRTGDSSRRSKGAGLWVRCGGSRMGRPAMSNG